jgi:hypothetical protein
MVDKNLEQKCLLLCSQFLPQLRIVGRDYEELFFCIMDLVDGSYYEQVVQQSTPTTLSLEGLVLSWDDQPKQNVHLPNLEALHLFYPKGDVVGLCDRFSTLTSLGFYEADGSVVMKVLQKMGQRLLRLVLEKVCQNLWLVEVLRLCPKLKMFRLQFCHLKDSSQFPEGLLSCLEEFVCDPHYSDPPHGFVAEVNNVIKSPRLNRNSNK